MRRKKWILAVLAAAVMVAAVAKAWFIEPIARIEPLKEVTDLSEEWIVKSGSLPSEGEMEYHYRIPKDDPKDLVFTVENCGEPFRVYLDGEPIFQYNDKYREKGLMLQWIPLSADAGGKELTLCIGEEVGEGLLAGKYASWIGPQDAVFLKVVEENLYMAFLGCFTIILGIAVTVMSFAFAGRSPVTVKKSFRYLGIFIFLTGVWEITDSSILQIVTGKTAVITLFSFFSFMMMPCFFVCFMKTMMTEGKKALSILEFLYLANAVFTSGSYLFRIFNLYETLSLQHILIVVSVITVLFYGIREVRQKENRKIRKTIIGLGFLALSGMISLGVFYTGFFRLYPVFYSTGLFIFIGCLASTAVDELYYHLEASASTKVYRSLAYTDVMTRMNNRSAFIEDQERREVKTGEGCIVMDINNLKQINDQYGHLEGDSLIRDAAECIRQVFEGIGICYRMGGDEFVVILENTTEEDLKKNIQNLERQLEYKNRDRKFPIVIASGYEIAGEEGSLMRDLLDGADAGMYRKKQAMKEKHQKI